jgi:hypothetical protein
MPEDEARRAPLRAIVRPVPSGEWKYAQSKYDALPRTPFRILVSGKSASGKGVLTVNAVSDFWDGCFDSLFVFASTAHVDSTWKAIEHYAYRKLGQGRRGRFMYDSFNESALREIVENQKVSIARQKADPDRKGPLKGCLLIFDDLSHDGNLRKMQGGVMAELWTTARHYGISLWANVHSINSLGALARRQASAIIVFPIANWRETEAIREQYGQMAGSLKAFDRIMDIAIGPQSEPFSFLCIRADSKAPNRTFMLRFEAWLEPVEDA